MNSKKLILIAVTLISLFTLAPSVFAQAKRPVPEPSSPEPLKYTGLRGVQYCEVALLVLVPGKAVYANYFNTSGLNNAADRMDTCPPDLWAKINPEQLKTQYDIATAFKNGPRGWTMDWIDLPAGPVVDFDGLKTRWLGKAELPPEMTSFKAGDLAYKMIKSHRKSTMTFEKGKPVFILDDPDGTPWVMQAFSKIVDPSVSYDGLKDLGSKIHPRAGWKYRVVTLDKDLTISTPEGYNWLTQDELENTYDACKEGACNFKP